MWYSIKITKWGSDNQNESETQDTHAHRMEIALHYRNQALLAVTAQQRGRIYRGHIDNSKLYSWQVSWKKIIV